MQERRKGPRRPSSLSSPLTPSPTSSFTDEDEHVIQHCFHYTGTVLTSTLAFQKEQKLKCECQVSACLELFPRTCARQPQKAIHEGDAAWVI